MTMIAFYEFLNVSLALNLSAVLLVLATVFCLGAFFITRWQNRKHKSEIDKIMKNLKVVTSASVGMGQRLIELESNIANLRDVQDEFKHKDLDFSYSQAHKLIRQGLSSDTVAANSGLSISEVSLMELMQQEYQSSSERILSPSDDAKPGRKSEERARSFRSSGLLESV